MFNLVNQIRYSLWFKILGKWSLPPLWNYTLAWASLYLFRGLFCSFEDLFSSFCGSFHRLLQESQVDPMWLCLIRWLTIKPPSNSLKGWHRSKSSTEWSESNSLDFKAGVLTLRWILPLSYCRYVLSLLDLLLPYIVLVTLGSV